MYDLVQAVLFVFGLVGLGYVAGLTGYLKPEVGDSLSEFAINVALPALLFNTMAKADFQGADPLTVWLAYFSASAVAGLAGHIATTRLFGRDAQAGVVGGVAASFSNLLLLGSPLMLGVFGQPGFEILSLVIAVQLPLLLTVSIILFNLMAVRDERAGLLSIVADIARRVTRNTLILGILAGLFWRLGGLTMPAIADRLIVALSGAAGTVALVAMGLGLRRFGISGNVRQALVLTGLKLFLMPAAALAIVILLGMPPLAAKVVVIGAAMPAGVNAYLIAMQFGTGQGLASTQITLSAALAAASISLWLAITTSILG
jgi:predicted permease